MSTDDEFARSLRERASATVPTMSVDAATTLHLGRRRVRTRHAWQVGSVVAAVGVVAVAVAPMLPITGPRGTSVATPAGVSTPAPTARLSAPATTTGATPASGPTAQRVATDSTAVLGGSVVAKAELLEQEMYDAMDTPYDASVWEDFSFRLDALVTQADAANARHPHTDAVELGYFVFPERYTQRLTSWIGWDNVNRVTLAWDAQHAMLRESTVSPEGTSGQDTFVGPAGSGTLTLITDKKGRALSDGSELTYRDAKGKHYAYDVFSGWTSGSDIAMVRLAPASGYTVDVTADQRTVLEHLSAQAMSSGSGLVAANDLEPLMSAVASTRHPKKDTGVPDVVSAGIFPAEDSPTPASMFVLTKHAQWNGWIGGRPTVVSAGAKADAATGPTSTGEVRVVTGSGGFGDPYTLKGTGALTLESESQGVLTLRDAHGATHRFDLATMSWV
ncbi:hypothetical protein ACFT5B_16775 [Luteimicrobium sp. NPDC057192]|uniref:hypothetical protein n=1 Tax=Luteimicrobium sp. NPDC057192 TaxID=3346042 RepID=UPI0036434F9A